MHTNRSLAAAVLQALRFLRLAGSAEAAQSRQLGQVLPIFVLLAVALIGGSALLTDVAWWWTNEQRMQRAADAAALAGAVYLPGNEGLAFSAARQEATKNGYTTDGNVVVQPRRDPFDPRKLIVDIDGSVQTNFARVFCWDGGPCLQDVDVGVTGAAAFVLPVPMGSPQNYFGLGRLVDAVQTPRLIPHTGDTTNRGPTTWASGTWNSPGGANGSGDTWTATNGATHVWAGFDFSALPDPLTITGIRVRLQDAEISGNTNTPDCRIRARLSWNGTDWSTPIQSSRLTTSDVTLYFPPGSTSNGWLPLSAWEPPTHAWSRAELASSLRVELTRVGNASNCPSSRNVLVGDLDVEVRYDWTETTVVTTIQETDVEDPHGAGVLTPQNFWAALQSQGAPNIQGDAYMTYYDTRKNPTNDDFDPANYYRYGVEFPPGAQNGEIWLFDPGFCHVDADKGTGEYYTLGGANGSSSFNPVSTYYELWADYNHTPLIPTDDTNLFGPTVDWELLRLRDTVLDASSPVTASPCDDLAWHNEWVQVANDIDNDSSQPLVVSVHTYSTPKANWGAPGTSNQVDATALNAFAIWADADGGTPRVYGLGAMEAYFPLPAGKVSEFYLAQVDAEHDGKTLEIKLWDPGDTGGLAADLRILAPGADEYVPVTFTYDAEPNSGNASNCRNRDGTANHVVTNTGGSSLFNGCWLTITTAIVDADDPTQPYTAPHPREDNVTSEGGWWKIEYTMSGNIGDTPATDLTTWQVSVIGNPVHLVVE